MASMPLQTNCYHKLFYHLIFATKHRSSMLTSEVMLRVKEAFRKKEEEFGLKIFIMNGVEEHIHLLVAIPPKFAVGQIVRHLKGYSSRMNPSLYWSDGYSALTVDNSSFDRIFNYIANQQEHHSSTATPV